MGRFKIATLLNARLESSKTFSESEPGTTEGLTSSPPSYALQQLSATGYGSEKRLEAERKTASDTALSNRRLKSIIRTMSVSDRDLNDAHAILAAVVEACGEKFLPLFDSLDREVIRRKRW